MTFCRWLLKLRVKQKTDLLSDIFRKGQGCSKWKNVFLNPERNRKHKKPGNPTCRVQKAICLGIMWFSINVKMMRTFSLHPCTENQRSSGRWMNETLSPGRLSSGLAVIHEGWNCEGVQGELLKAQFFKWWRYGQGFQDQAGMVEVQVISVSKMNNAV